MELGRINMADNIVSGLFGLDPASLQAQQQATDYAQAFKYAQLNPSEQAQFGGFLGGQQLGRAVPAMFGIEDPILAKANTARRLASQFDITSAEGLRGYASALAQNGAPDLAQLAIQRANQLTTTALTQLKTAEETRLLGREIKEIGVPNNPELVQKAVVDKDGNIIQRIGDPISRFTSKQNISVDAKGEAEFVKKLATLDAKRVDDAATARDNAIAGLNNLNQLANLNEQELIGGAFATTRVGAVNFLNTLGLVGERDVQRLSASEQYAKTASDLVLQTLGGRLGAGFSNEDRKFIERIVPQLENSADARRQLITFMQTKFTNIVNEADRLENYARDNNSLKGYKYTTPIPKAAPSKSQYTRVELEAELQRRTQGNK